MAKNIALKANLDNPMLLYNRSTWRANGLKEELPQAQSMVAASVMEALGPSDIIFFSLGDDAAVESTFTAVLEGDVTGKLLVDCSTTSAATTAKIAGLISKAGDDFFACPGRCHAARSLPPSDG